MKKMLLATGNSGKLREIKEMLAGSGIQILPQALLGVHEIAESGANFLENALIKARHAARQTGMDVIADDSGLEVDALRGAPGVYSARYAGPHASDADNLSKLLRDLASVPMAQRTARFRCVMACIRWADDPAPLVCEGVWEGRILDAPRGNNGFGYDPVFLPAEQACSAAELAPADKNRLSHRGQALRRLVAQLTCASG